MNRCRKRECITTPHSTNHQSITGGKPVSSGTDGPTKNAISLTPFYQMLFVCGQRKRVKMITKARYQQVLEDECFTNPYLNNSQSTTYCKPVSSGTDTPAKNAIHFYSMLQVWGQQKRGRKSRCGKPECITSPYSNNNQIVILCLLVLMVPQKMQYY